MLHAYDPFPETKERSEQEESLSQQGSGTATEHQLMRRVLFDLDHEEVGSWAATTVELDAPSCASTTPIRQTIEFSQITDDFIDTYLDPARP